MSASAAPTFANRFASVVGDAHVLTDPADMTPYLAEERGTYQGKATLVVRPGTTGEVADCVRLAAELDLVIVPQGGNTGLCGGAVGFDAARTVILATRRLNRIRDVDATDFTMTVEAGCILAEIQQAADAADRFFPLSLGAEGTCQIGGNIATNAGGINVLRYGGARDLVLGLEMVLPDGRIYNGLKRLRKDNTGYALAQLFAGSEGTLGIITAATLKLFPKPVERQTALCALEKVENVTALLARARQLSGDSVSSFELISAFAMGLCETHIDGARNPVEGEHPWYVLMELSTSRPNAGLRDVFETLLETAFEEEIISDAAIAESLDQAAQLWRMREAIPEAQKHEGASIKHDVSVPVSSVPAFITRTLAALTNAFPGCRPCPFGHAGDGNIHFNVTQPAGVQGADFLALRDDMNRLVHDITVREFEGSLSAEHGVGHLKVDELVHYKDPVDIDVMRAIKTALDPAGRLNPGKVVRVP